MGLLFVVFLALVSADCTVHLTCNECGDFLDSTGASCKWCALGNGGRAVGCVDSATACPGTSSALSKCPPLPCERMTNCNDCVNQVAPSGGNCGWCMQGYYSNTLNIGCRDPQDGCGSTNGGSYAGMSYGCNVAAIVPTILWSVSAGFGLLFGAFVYIATLKSELQKLVQASIGLFFLSFVFFGASLFSFMLSVRVVNKLASRKCCTCNCFWIWFLGCHEVTTVLAGVLTGAIMDGTIPQYYYGGSFPGFFSVLIGLPTVYGGLLAFGIPRVAIMSCHARANKKVKVDDDDDVESINGSRHDHRESAPLIPSVQHAPAMHTPTVQTPAVHTPVTAPPPSYFPAPSYQAAPAAASQYVAGETGQPYHK